KPAVLETGVNKGSSVVETVLIENRGFVPVANVELNLRAVAEETLPSWATLIGETKITRLLPGESKSIDISFSPPLGVVDGVKNYAIELSNGDGSIAHLPISLATVENGESALNVHVANYYTAT